MMGFRAGRTESHTPPPRNTKNCKKGNSPFTMRLKHRQNITLCVYNMHKVEGVGKDRLNYLNVEVVLFYLS